MSLDLWWAKCERRPYEYEARRNRHCATATTAQYTRQHRTRHEMTHHSPNDWSGDLSRSGNRRYAYHLQRTPAGAVGHRTPATCSMGAACSTETCCAQGGARAQQAGQVRGPLSRSRRHERSGSNAHDLCGTRVRLNERADTRWGQGPDLRGTKVHCKKGCVGGSSRDDAWMSGEAPCITPALR